MRMDSVATGRRESVTETRKHQCIVERTERKLLVNPRPNDIGVDDQAVGHIVQGEKDRVGQQELETISTKIAGDEI